MKNMITNSSESNIFLSPISAICNFWSISSTSSIYVGRHNTI